MKTFTDVIISAMNDKYYERTATTRDRSVREMKLGPHHIRHRFPFRGGINFAGIMASNIERSNPLLERLMARKSQG